MLPVRGRGQQAPLPASTGRTHGNEHLTRAGKGVPYATPRARAADGSHLRLWSTSAHADSGSDVDTRSHLDTGAHAPATHRNTPCYCYSHSAARSDSDSCSLPNAYPFSLPHPVTDSHTPAHPDANPDVDAEADI